MRECSVEFQNLQTGHRILLDGLEQLLFHSQDLVLPRQENKNIALGLSLVDLPNAAKGSLDVVFGGAHQVVDISGVHPALDGDEAVSPEVPHELLAADGGRHDHQPHFYLVLEHHFPQDRHQQVRVQTPLVHFIQNKHIIKVPHHDFPEGHAIC